MLVSIPESRRDVPQHREEDDKTMCKKLFKETLRDVHIEQIYRMGRSEEGKMRPLTVKLSSTGAKWELVKRGKNLREEEEQHSYV